LAIASSRSLTSTSSASGRSSIDRVDDLVGEDHRRHAQDVVVHRPDRDEVLLGADDHARDRHLAGLAPWRRAAAGTAWRRPGRAQVVRVVVEDRVDLREVTNSSISIVLVFLGSSASSSSFVIVT
jgi:hypothetical protein